MDDVRAFIDAVEAFFGHLAAVAWAPFGIAVLLHVVKLVLRIRAWQNILRAAYPDSRIPYRTVFGAYVAGVGVNSITPARGGDLVKLYLAKHRVEGSTYPTLGSTLVVETIFDFVVAAGLFFYALKLGLLPGLPDLRVRSAFDWSFVIEHPYLSAMLGSILLGAAFLLAGWAGQQVVAFRAKVNQGLVILRDRRAFLVQVVSWQALSWIARVGSVYFFLEAFNIDPGVQTAVAVLVVQGLSTILPFTPGGVGAQQAVLVLALAGTASSSAVLSFSVGMQLATVAANIVLGFGAIALMLGTLRWRSRVGEVQPDPPAEEPEATAPPPRRAVSG